MDDPGTGAIDILVTNHGEATDGLALLFNNGTGFDPPSLQPSGPNPVAVAAAVGGGGGIFSVFPTFVTANTGDNTVTVLAACGCGPSQVINLPDTPRGVALTDIDGQGALDLVITLPNAVVVYRGGGLGHLPGPAHLHAGLDARPVTTGRLDGDASTDVLAPLPGENAGMTFINNGTGLLTPQTTTGAGAGPAGASIADFNDDGAQDAVVADEHGQHGPWLFNAPTTGSPGLDYGAVTVGARSASLPISFTNTGAAPLVVAP